MLKPRSIITNKYRKNAEAQVSIITNTKNPETCYKHKTNNPCIIQNIFSVLFEFLIIFFSYLNL